jgi:hypothetical protein
MRAQRVMGHQLLGNLFRERGIQTALHIDCSKFLVLGLVVCLDLRAFHAKRGLFGIRLGADRHVLAGRHRHGARDQPGNTGRHHAAVRPIRGGDTKHQARGRDNAVIGTQYRCAQPADAVRAAPFRGGARSQSGFACLGDRVNPRDGVSPRRGVGLPVIDE